MAIKPRCDFCRCELRDFGALLFSPPTKRSVVRKWHICRTCYKEMIAKR